VSMGLVFTQPRSYRRYSGPGKDLGARVGTSPGNHGSGADQQGASRCSMHRSIKVFTLLVCNEMVSSLPVAVRPGQAFMSSTTSCQCTRVAVIFGPRFG